MQLFIENTLTAYRETVDLANRSYQIGRGSVGFNPLYALAASDDVSCQNFSRLSFRVSLEKISHNSAFLMKA